MPHLNELHEKFGGKGVVIVGVTSESIELAKPWAEAKGAKYPLVSDPSAKSSEAYGVNGIPAAFLIDAKGKVIWAGHPATLTEALIEQAVVGAVSPFGPLTEQLAPVQELIDKHMPGKALAMLQTLLKAGSLDARSKQLAEFTQTSLNGQAYRLLARATALFEGKDPLEAAILLHEVAARFDGCEPAKDAQQKLKDMAKDKELKREVDGAALLAKARQCESDKLYDDAYALYKKTTGLGRSKAKDEAERAMGKLDAQGLRGFKPDCPDCTADGRACKRHKKR